MAISLRVIDLPDVAFENIFSFMSYDEIAKNRIVCRRFNNVGSRMLSRGFMLMEKRHAQIYKRVKSLLPRRESERRVHPLSRQCDILQAIETRISMLNMTYMKYIESNLLCFIPGKVLDEINNLLNLIESDFTPPRSNHLLQELRDLSSMAMEHFDEYILPRVKEHKQQLSDEKRQQLLSAFTIIPKSKLIDPKEYFFKHLYQKDIQKFHKLYKTYRYQVQHLTQDTQKLSHRIRRQNYRLKAQMVKIREQDRKIQEQSSKIQEQEAILIDIKKQMDEWDQKYKDLTTELVRTRVEVLLNDSKETTSTVKSALTSSTLYKPIIGPRQVVPTFPFNIKKYDTERKRKSDLLPNVPSKITRTLRQNDNDFEQKKEDNLNIPRTLGSENIKKRNFTNFFENIVKSSFTNRKRKINEDIDLI